MPVKKSPFVMLSRHVLAVGTVVAIAAPALSVVDLDIVAPAPRQEAAARLPQAAASLVAVEPVAPTVIAEPVDGVEKRGLEALTSNPRAQQRAEEDLAALSAPEPVDGYATVGVTWKSGTEIDDEDIAVSVRSLGNGEWSQWETVEYHDEHGPDPDSPEGRNARPGTEPVIVGDVDSVQVKAVTASGEAPPDMELALIDPGKARATAVEPAEIDTAALSSAGTDAAAPVTDKNTQGLELSASSVTPRPQIYSRAQWGADERMRDKSSLRYFEVHAGFVHHTVNSNNYSRAQVPSLMRGIYAYHTQSRGWSDVGYNFIVDRFGRIWEGRYGGVDRPVVGAHTLGYNDYSFAMSALGNFDITRPSNALVAAYGRLMAWKLSLHGVDAGSMSQVVGSRRFPAINGHRDAGSTACPGRYLYAKLGTIRSLANNYQASFEGRDKATSLSGTHWPDLAVRDERTNRVHVVRTAGQMGFLQRRTAARGWQGMDLITPVGDVTGDGKADMVARVRATGVTAVYPGNGSGQFGAAVRPNSTRFASVDQLFGATDVTGDGRNDLVARDATTKRLYYYRGTNRGWFRARRLMSRDWSHSTMSIGTGDMTGDGNADVVVRERTGRLVLWHGNGRGGLSRRTTLSSANWNAFDLVGGFGDLTGDGKADLVARRAKDKLVYVYPGTGTGSLTQPYGPYGGFRDVNVLAPVGNVAGNRRVDLVGRASNGDLVVYPHNGRSNLGGTVDTGLVARNTDLLLNVGDWDGDRINDIVTRSSTSGYLYLRKGLGRNRFGTATRMAKSRWGGVRLLAAVGDITGDGHPDLMGQPAGSAMRVWPGNGKTGFRRAFVAHSPISGTDQMGVGLFDADGSPDTVVRNSRGGLVLFRGNGPGGLSGGSTVSGSARGYDWVSGVGDADGDGRRDLIAREAATGRLWLLPGTRSGFGARRFIADGFARYDLSS